MYWRSLDDAPVSPRSNQDQDLIVLLLPSRVRLARLVLERMSCLSTVLQHSLLTRCVQSPNKQWIKHLWVPCRRSTRVFAVVRGRKRSEQHQRQMWWTPRCSMRALLPRWPHLLSEWWTCSKITSYLEIMNIFYCCFHLTAQSAGESPANPKKWIKYLYFIFYKRSTSILWRKTVLNRQNVSPLDRSWLIADKCLIVHRYCKSLTFIYWTEHILVEFWLEIIGIYTTSFHEY